VALVACQAVFGQGGNNCAPMQWQTNYILTGDAVAMYGFLAVDYKGSKFVMNQTGIQSNGFGYSGEYLNSNGSAFWISNGACFKISDSNPVSNQTCLPPNGTWTATPIAGVNGSAYNYNQMDANGQFVNTTTWFYIGSSSNPEPHVPVAYQEYAPQTPERAPYAANFLFLNPSETVDPELFVIPSICEGAELVELHMTPFHKYKEYFARLI